MCTNRWHLAHCKRMCTGGGVVGCNTRRDITAAMQAEHEPGVHLPLLKCSASQPLSKQELPRTAACLHHKVHVGLILLIAHVADAWRPAGGSRRDAGDLKVHPGRPRTTATAAVLQAHKTTKPPCPLTAAGPAAAARPQAGAACAPRRPAAPAAPEGSAQPWQGANTEVEWREAQTERHSQQGAGYRGPCGPV